MMRPLYALVASLGLVLLAAPVSASAPTAATDQDPSRCAPEPCGTINVACQKLFHGDCVGAEAKVADARCMGPVCDAVNAVCYTLTKQWCLG
jgi:hypothetical protein